MRSWHHRPTLTRGESEAPIPNCSSAGTGVSCSTAIVRVEGVRASKHASLEADGVCMALAKHEFPPSSSIHTAAAAASQAFDDTGRSVE